MTLTEISLRRLAIAICVGVYLVYSSFGFAHPVLWGHFGHHTSEYLLRALASLRFGLVVPATSPGLAPPLPDTIYLHHPIGYHHVYTLLIALVGNHAWLGAVVPALSGLLVIWALHGLVRCCWGPWPAVLAVAVWVALPFVWALSILTDPIFPAMACSIVITHAFVHYLEAPSRSRLLQAAAATAVGALLSWEAVIQTMLFGMVALLWMRRRPLARLGRHWAALLWIGVTSSVIAATLALHFALVLTHGRLADLSKGYGERSHAGAMSTVLSNGYWMLILYGPVLETIGGLWLVLFLNRLRRGRARTRDLAVLTFFAINLVYIGLFPEATKIHLYRVYWMSTSLVLATVDLAVAAYEHLAQRRREGIPGRSPRRIALLGIGLLLVLVLPQSIYVLLQSRVMMGALGHGKDYDSDRIKLQFAGAVARWTDPADVIALVNVPHRVELLYLLDRTVRTIGSLDEVTKPGVPSPAAVLTDANPPAAQKKALDALLAHHPARRLDRWLMIDLRARGAGLRTFTLVPRAPSWSWRWFVSHHYPPLDLVETTPLPTMKAGHMTLGK